jgi:subtilisin family serine protease
VKVFGEGVLVATLDTGVDGDHPALADRWAGVADPRYEGHPEWAWYDP